jgi:phosphonate transport system substrate-binding protein
MQRRVTLALLATTAALWLGAAQAQSAPREISFGIISTESSANLKSAWQPLLDDLAKGTGLKVRAFFAPDYAGVIEGMRFNKVQVAWMGNKSGMEAVDRASGEVFAKVTQADGSQGYHTVMIVHRDSPVKSLDDVLRQRASLTLGFGDPNSTSGTLVPGHYAFAANRVDPLRDFKRTVRANHETNMLAVANRQVDVATVSSDGMDRLRIKMAERHAELREVWRSPLIPSDPMLWRKDLDADVKRRLLDFFLAYGRDQREKDILRNLTFAGFVRSDDRQLLPIRQLELARERTKVEADTAMPADEKARRLQELQRRLDDLGRQVASVQ